MGNWIYYFEPKRKCSNRVWATKMLYAQALLRDGAESKKYCMSIFLTRRVQLCNYMFQRAEPSQRSIKMLFRKVEGTLQETPP